MSLEIEKAKGIGFCFGVRRALNILEKAARECGTVETLGAIVHNQPVLDRLASIGVRIASGVDDIRGNLVNAGDVTITGARGFAYTNALMILTISIRCSCTTSFKASQTKAIVPER